MNEKMMHLKMNNIFTLLKSARDSPIMLLLLHHAYNVQMMSSFVNQIHALGIEVQHILEEYTELYQPVEVGAICSIKQSRKRW